MSTAPESRFCHCCAPAAPLTPAEVWNRPGLSNLAYRLGTFATFREAMLLGIASQPELNALATRESDDYAVTLIELFAAVGDVLTFYNERIANELFLRTARERDSILRLVRLIGYRLRPGLSATALLSFALDTGATTKLRQGLKVMSIPGQDERPQTFETLEAIVGDARLNALSVFAPPLPFNPFQHGRRIVPLLSRPVPLNRGDRLVIFSATTLEEKSVVDLSIDRDVERLTFAPPVQASTLWPGVARLARVERRLRFFGHNAADQYQAYDTSAATPPAKRWKTISAGDPGYDLGFSAFDSRYPLDRRDDALKPGMNLLIDAGAGASPRYRTAVVTATAEDAAVLGIVANTAPHMQETVTYASLAQTVHGRPVVGIGGPGSLVFARTGAGRVVELDALRWEPIGLMNASEDLALASPGPTSLHLIARDANLALQLNTRVNGVWGAWIALGSTATSRPAAVGLSTGEVLVLARGPSFGLRVRSIADPSWITLGGVLTSPPVPVSWGGSRVDVFVRGLDRGLWRLSRSGGSWGSWESLAGTLASTPAAAATAPNRLDVVAIDDAGGVIHRRWTGTDWTPWFELGGQAQGEPAIVATGADRVDIFVRGRDNQLWQITRSGGTWSAWTPRGGALSSSPSALPANASIFLIFRDADGVAAGAIGNSFVFPPFSRVGSGLGEIPDRRRTRIFEIATPDLETREYDYPPQLTGGRVVARRADAAGLDPLDKRRRILIDTGGLPHVALVTASQLVASTPGDAADHVLIDFTPPLVRPIDRAVLMGNVAKASHGETQPDEPLGNGDARKAFASYRLRRSPVTYLQGTAQVEGVAALEVRINGERWNEVSSLYARSPTERVYTARQNDAGETDVTFGDGNTGSRVPTGAGNIMARYRTGSGLAGRVRAGQLAIPLERPVGMRTVTNPLPAEGGADPEDRDDARRTAPTTVRTFGRIVSLEDFAWLATTSGLVARAHATSVWRKLKTEVHLTVAGPGGVRLAADTRATLYSALTASRDPNRTLLLGNLVRVPLVVRAKIVRDPAFEADAVLAGAREALLAAMAFERMALGAAVHASDIYAAIQSAAGVVGVDVDVFHLKGFAALTAAERALRAVTTASVQEHIRIFEARPTPADPAEIDRYARAGFDGPVPPPVLAAEQAFIEHPANDVELLIVEAL